jgi:hypothetical protein
MEERKYESKKENLIPALGNSHDTGYADNNFFQASHPSFSPLLMSKIIITPLHITAWQIKKIPASPILGRRDNFCKFIKRKMITSPSYVKYNGDNDKNNYIYYYMHL